MSTSTESNAVRRARQEVDRLAAVRDRRIEKANLNLAKARDRLAAIREREARKEAA